LKRYEPHLSRQRLVLVKQRLDINSCSRPRAGRGAFRPAGGVLVLLGLMVSGAVFGTVLVTQDEALSLAFPGARVERHTAYLDEEQMEEARSLAGRHVEILRAMVPYYLAVKDGVLVGTAYFDTHLVRTEAATVMYVVDAAGRMERVEMISFAEPQEYLPRPAWLAQFDGRLLDEDLALKRGIRGMTGASLTALSVTRGARRVLALHAVIAPGHETAQAGEHDAATPDESEDRP
jgi:hypothetical protein